MALAWFRDIVSLVRISCDRPSGRVTIVILIALLLILAVRGLGTTVGSEHLSCLASGSALWHCQTQDTGATAHATELGLPPAPPLSPLSPEASPAAPYAENLLSLWHPDIESEPG